MALIRCDFFSDVLQLGTSMTVLLPQASEEQIGAETTTRSGPPPVLYLLHGLSDRLGVAALHLDRPLRLGARAGGGDAAGAPQASTPTCHTRAAATGPSSPRSCPEVVGDFFRVSDKREDTFVAGLSMGGYGALKWSLAQPERFAAAATMSGAVERPSST